MYETVSFATIWTSLSLDSDFWNDKMGAPSNQRGFTFNRELKYRLNSVRHYDLVRQYK